MKQLKKQRPASRLYRSAKISEYRFRKVLMGFVKDWPANATARATGLSVNSTTQIYHQLRTFFFEVGLFLDFYAGQDPLTFVGDTPRTEKALLEFHFSRVGARRGLKSPITEPPLHFAESCWRYDFKVLSEQRASDLVDEMMFNHLLELIRACGPIGARPRNREEGLRIILRQIDQRILWLERNAPGFADAATRAALRDARTSVLEEE